MEALSFHGIQIISGRRVDRYQGVEKIINNRQRVVPLIEILLSIIILVTAGRGNATGAYQPPVGIPAPSFGINEISPPQPALWPGAAVSNYYYIDNTHPSATDSSNTYGYPNKPRLTIPATTYSAGAYVEIHGGPYTQSSIAIVANGTAANPVWIRGSSATTRPTLRTSLTIRGSYVIVENLKFENNKYVSLVNSLHHAAIRGCDISGTGTDIGNGSGVYISGSSGDLVSNLVVYNNTIHDIGDYTSTTENDYHGVKPARYADSIWILKNNIYHMGGDSVQVGNDTPTDYAIQPKHVYIGGNELHDGGENAVDIKSTEDIIISSNDLHGFNDRIASSDGAVVVIHNYPNRVWVINNTIHDGIRGIRANDGGGTNTWAIGNLIYNIHHSVTQTSWTGDSDYALGGALFFNGADITGGMVGNTLYNNDVGIQIPSGSGSGFVILNNIISHRSEATADDVRIGYTLTTGTTIDNNLFYLPSGLTKIHWNTTSVNLATFKSTVKKCLNCLEGNPLFVDPANNKFPLTSTSPAIDKGIVSSVYATFQSRYGIDLAKDISLTPRPQNGVWDIGAYEFTDTLTPPAPTTLPAPTIIDITPN